MSGQPFSKLTAVAVPLVRDNVNTDAIIPSREMKTVSRKGLADGLFADWRYRGVGSREPDPAFPLNDPRFQKAKILLAGANFGCGSSREHAAWALVEYGFRAILAESFNPIFRGNAILNGIVPAVLDRARLEEMAKQVSEGDVPHTVGVDLDTMQVTAPDGTHHGFALDAEARTMLREGLDTIDLTLKYSAAIAAFREADRSKRPWAYP